MLTSISEVSVNGGLGRHCLSIKLMAAVQLPWQSNRVVTMPPDAIPGKHIHLLNGTHALSTISSQKKKVHWQTTLEDAKPSDVKVWRMYAITSLIKIDSAGHAGVCCQYTWDLLVLKNNLR